MRKNEKSLICPGYSLGWTTGWVLRSATKIEDCRESAGAGKGEREENSALWLFSSECLWRHPGSVVYLVGISLHSEKLQKEVIRTETDSEVIRESRG